MNVLFFIRHPGYLRTFESTLEDLLHRGHQIHIALGRSIAGPAGKPAVDLLESLERNHANLTVDNAPGPGSSRWERFGTAVRYALDYLRYLEQPFIAAEKLRRRAARNAPAVIVNLAGGPAERSNYGRAALRRLLRIAERAVPARAEDLAYIANQAPDLVLVTPLLDGENQYGYLRAAHNLGIPAGLCVSSWDNLTSKGLIHGEPDFVTLWNNWMRTEAITLHRIHPDRIVVTGAQVFDHWFTWEPSTSREAFCNRIGLDPSNPFFLYMCSSSFIAGKSEADYIDRWIEKTREHPALRDVGVLVRPHPANLETWQDRRLADPCATALWDVEESVPIATRAKQEFYDSVYHSAGVVGLNTSSLIESSIIGRPVFTLVDDETRATQSETPHFNLIAADGGVLHVAVTLEEHHEQLAAALDDPAFGRERRRQFVEAFVRPHGIGERATDRLVAAIEERAHCAKEPQRAGPAVLTVRAVLAPATLLKWPTQRERDRRRKLRARKRQG